ncbi:thymidine phosphorylase [bacterium]|nr:thymidine phosphorylase [bacterium]
MVYLRPKKLDILGDNASLEVYINRFTADQYGIKDGDLLDLFFVGHETGATAIITDTIVDDGHIGIPASVWNRFPVSELDRVAMEIQGQAKSIKSIRKKIKGEKLSYDEIREIMYDIAKRRLSPIEMTYFASTSYNPGFDEEEMFNLTKAMADTGIILDFSQKGGMVVDKHSIGGLPSKGVTPVIVALLSSLGFVVPNTSTRAITAPAGTTDVLETLMPVALSEEEIKRVVNEVNGCLVWGGGLDLAPADDILIQIEKPLHIESYDKFVVSIIAKKLAAGCKYVLLDLPYGETAKVPDKDVARVAKMFEDLFVKFNIRVFVYKRKALGPDGNGIGPILEARDVLWILERDKRRPIGMENLALDMAAQLIALTGKYTYQGAHEILRETLENGEANKQFWKIAKAQGAQEIKKSNELLAGHYTYDIKSTKSGIIRSFDNHLIVQVTRALGAPYAKGAGIYLHRQIGDRIAEGEAIATLYAEAQSRIDLAVRNLDGTQDSWILT